ncbi:MAG: family 16 glycosylhydrolase [Planctomycetes bacterium]|nr:family 16 glycosylhydrolase [Planctomycetota bacterium]
MRKNLISFVLVLSILTIVSILTAPTYAQYQLVWSDEFDGATINANNWEYQTGDGCAEGICGWGNNELQWYTDTVGNSYVQNGNLVIVAKAEQLNGKEFTSAKLRTKYKQDFLYGRMEARMKLPTGGGMWPAFWMMPTDEVYGGWAASGEIDIMESSNQTDYVGGAIHFGGGWPDNTYSSGTYSPGGINFADDFHTYAIEWEPTEMRWYVDGILYFTETNWWSEGGPYPAPFDQDFHFIINVAVGGNYTGCTDPGCITASLPQQMLVDWVRVYQDTPGIDIEAIISSMTLDEKVGQMTQAERNGATPADVRNYFLGSILSGGGSHPASNTPTGWADMHDSYQNEALNTRLGIPILYGVDAVHGHSNVIGATIFPHNIGLGATRDPDLMEEIGRITAKEVAMTGLEWTFSPAVMVPRDERWGRTYEGFGEDPNLQLLLAARFVKGLQGITMDGESVVACAKHFAGDGGTNNGIDQGNTICDEATLRDIHMQGYLEAINQNVATIMPSFSSWNGVKMTENTYLLTDVLKTEFGFDGFLISDWEAVGQLSGASYYDDVVLAVNAGIDMGMEPYNWQNWINAIKTAVGNGDITMTRIDDAVRRILRIKDRSGAFDTPLADRTLVNNGELGSAAHRAVAREAVRKSLVMLKNDGTLPISKGSNVFVAGKNANDIGNQCGGWTISWQGSSGNITTGTTILEGIQDAVSSGGGSVTFSENGTGSAGYDVAIVVIGETPYAEGSGYSGTLALDSTDTTCLSNIDPSVPIVVVLVSGRPMIVNSYLGGWDAFVAAWLPGTEGDGVADVLFGDFDFVGKLSHSWPVDIGQVPINVDDLPYAPLYAYDYGLSYASIPPTVSITNPSDGSNPPAGNIVIDATASDSDGSIVTVEFYEGSNYLGEDTTSPYSLTWNSMTDGCYTIMAKAIDDAGLANSDTISITVGTGCSGQQPYNGSPEAIPGQIEAEDYDTGGEGVAYHDNDGGNNGGQYRPLEAVDIENCSEGGYNIGWMSNSEWIEYTVNVATAGEYTIEVRVASNTTGGNFHLEFDGTDETGNISVPSTGGWQNWTTVSATATLSAGTQIMRFANANSGDEYNINYYNFVYNAPADTDPPTPNPASFATAPYATGTTSIAMVAATGSDVSGPVEYRFTETSGNPGGTNSSWQTSTSYTDSGLNASTQYTYTVQMRDSLGNTGAASSGANATTDTVPDTDPPTPNPASFATAPYATGTTSIAMIAATGSDVSGPVEYRFTETSGNPGGTNSPWQTSTSYTDSGLNASTQYTYTVQMRDSLGNTGTASSGANATTDAVPDTDPPTPNPASFATAPYATGTTSIAMVAATGSDVSGPVEYRFTETSGNPGGTNSSWQTSTSYTDSGLNASTQYTYSVQMRDSLGNTGAASSGANATTDTPPDVTAPTPNPMTWSVLPYATGETSISMTATTASDTSGVEYYFANLTDPAHDSGWQASSVYNDTGLTAATSYSYTVTARDMSVNQNQGGASTTESATTDTPTGGTIYDVANSDIFVSGIVSGSFVDTQTSDQVYQSITEVQSGGKPSRRYSTLEHKWTINVTGGQSVTFSVEAHRTASVDGDNFVFAYSTDNVNFNNMLIVTKTSDDDTPQSYVLPSNISGTVYIRVTDADSTRANLDMDTLYIDDMYIASSGEVVPCTPAEVHVDSIVSSTQSAGGGRKYGRVTVTIKDDCGNTIAGAQVTGTFSGSFNEQVTATTDASGNAVLTTSVSAKKPSYILCVDNVVDGSLPYNASANIENCDSL